MKKYNLVFMAFIFYCMMPAMRASSIRLALLDTGGQEKVVYEPFIDMAAAVGYVIDYYPVSRLLSSDMDSVLDGYDGAVIVLGRDVTKNLSSGGVALRSARICYRAAAGRNKVIMLLLPTMPPHCLSIDLIRPCIPCWYQGGDETIERQIVNYYAMVMRSAGEFMPLPYHTTLRLPAPSLTSVLDHSALALQEKMTFLPVNQQSAQKILPGIYGGYWYDEAQNNHCCCMMASMVLACSIQENFHLCPLDPRLRKAYGEIIMQMLYEVRSFIARRQRGDRTALTHKIENAPFQRSAWLHKVGKPFLAHHHDVKRQMAWMELVLFEPQEIDQAMSEEDRVVQFERREQRQREFIEDIFDAGLDTLWLSITPNIYYSRIGRMVTGGNLNKAQKNESRFLSAVGKFTEMLRASASRRGCAIPDIVLGFEIANNLYPPNLPRQSAYDLYGNHYYDIPAPLYRTFWDQEVIKPLDIFLEKWKDESISHGIKLSGIMLDLEMYNRKTTGVYPSLVGFDRPSMMLFARQHEIHDFPRDHEAQCAYLIEHGLLEQFFSFLEQGAFQLGRYLARYFRSKIDDCQIMCYLPSILTGWWYKGIFKGLQDGGGSPLYLLTFNSEYNAHARWFADNNLNVRHLCVVLLSKIKSSRDRSCVDALMQRHDGVWYNRFSRFAEDYNPSSWTHIEQSPMSSDEKKKFFMMLRKAQRSCWKKM